MHGAPSRKNIFELTNASPNLISQKLSFQLIEYYEYLFEKLFFFKFILRQSPNKVLQFRWFARR